jgi:LysR family transcriptional activator of nhaA
MAQINYRHLWYFHEIARAGTLTEAAHRLNLSQSALSSQLKTFEARLGHALFDRVGRRLELTEAGRIALRHSEEIFAVGQDLVKALDQAAVQAPPIRVGALSTLSRNFQVRFLRPLFERVDAEMILRSGTADVLLDALAALELDVVLTNAPPDDSRGGQLLAHKLAEQPVRLQGHPERVAHESLDALLGRERIILPAGSAIRAEVLGLARGLGITPRIVAEVDDMAMIRLLAREGVGVAVAPDVVVADELAAGRLVTAPFALGITERFYAITIPRRFPHPLLGALLEAAGRTR